MNSLTFWVVVQILVFQDIGFNFFSPMNFRFIYIYIYTVYIYTVYIYTYIYWLWEINIVVAEHVLYIR
jgi:hypothetical protein